MADWSDNFIASYRFVRVDRSTGDEVGEIRVLKGGTVTRNDDVRIKERAEASMVGEYDFGPDLVRVYLVARAATWVEQVALGTFIPVVPSRSLDSRHSVGAVKMYGRLQELLDSQFAAPRTVAKGESAVDAARAVCEEMGLTVIADESDYRVSDARQYGVAAKQNNSQIGDTKLDMVNDLLDLAGFRAAYTDPWGRVMFTRYADPDDIAPSWSFEEGPGARFEDSMTEERDYTSTANRVTVIYGTGAEGEPVIAEARDDDPESPLSTVSRGRVIDRVYSYTDLPPGKTRQEQEGYAARRAKSLLSTAQSVIHRVSMRHVFAPVTINETVELSFPSGDVSGTFQIRTQTISLGGGCAVSTELRRFRRKSLSRTARG